MVIHTPSNTNAAGSSGNKKLTTGSFCQSARRRNTNRDATESTAVVLSVNPM